MIAHVTMASRNQSTPISGNLGVSKLAHASQCSGLGRGEAPPIDTSNPNEGLIFSRELYR